MVRTLCQDGAKMGQDRSQEALGSRKDARDTDRHYRSRPRGGGGGRVNPPPLDVRNKEILEIMVILVSWKNVLL